MTDHTEWNRGPSAESCPARGIGGVIFDCDGVLVDSRQANIRFYNLILEELGQPPMDPEDEEYVHSQTVTESIRRIVPEGELERAFHAAKRVSYTSVLPWIEPQEGLIEGLDRLLAMGVPCAINTNRTNTMGLILDRFGLRKYFAPVVTAATVRHPKPHPESLYWILSTWKLSPEKVVFIGDTEVDRRTAAAAGVPFWAFGNEALSAGHHIRDHRQVSEAVERSYRD